MYEQELQERGATIVEYAIMIAVIALVAFLAVTALGISVLDIFSDDGLGDALS
jgi:Flp pilus assembly pilin Flp